MALSAYLRMSGRPHNPTAADMYQAPDMTACSPLAMGGALKLAELLNRRAANENIRCTIATRKPANGAIDVEREVKQAALQQRKALRAVVAAFKTNLNISNTAGFVRGARWNLPASGHGAGRPPSSWEQERGVILNDSLQQVRTCSRVMRD
jgi:hypothetical protein